jgi:ABC-type sugar transport system ATPase subunit
MGALVPMQGITKFFRPVKVLDQVDFSIYTGELHILAGVYADTQGRILMEDRKRARADSNSLRASVSDHVALVMV